MSNNSWKQYGGIAKMEEYNVINANTIVAEQFVSRSTKPIYQFLNGTFEVANDLSAANNIITSNSFFCFADTTVNNNIYANQKLFFGSGTFKAISPDLSADSTHAYMYGDASFIGVNIQNPNTIFHITSNVPDETNILLVESSNNYIRNILAQNKNDRGVVLDADDTSANLYFHLDSSTNKFNVSDANITYTLGGNLSTSVSNEFVVHSKFNNIFALENIHFDSSGGYALDTSGTTTLIDRSNANTSIDISGSYHIHSHDNYTITTNGNMNVQALNGNINIDTNKTNYNSFVNISHVTRGLSGEFYDQLLTVYDVSNVPFLPNMYDISGTLTGNSIVAIAKDASSNTFIRMAAGNSLLGAAYGGGAFPNDTSRSMNMIGVNDASGEYLHNQIIVSNNNKEKYISTLGINTFHPQSDKYTVDINGPVRIANGEIQTMTQTNFEFKSVKFSTASPLYGIAIGTPSTLTDDPTNPIYNQFGLYTMDGGINWNLSNNIYGTSDFNQTRVNFLDTYVYDSNYAFIVGEKSYIYYTNDSGLNWYRSTYGDLLFRDQVNVIGAVNGTDLRMYVPYKYNNDATSQIDSYTKQIRYFDIPIAELSTNLNGNLYSISSSEVSLNIDVECSTVNSSHVFFAGNGIAKFNIDLTGNPIYHLQSYTFHDIMAVTDDLIIAVGNNVISYSQDAGVNWSIVNIANDTVMIPNKNNITNIVLKSIFALNEQNIVVVGDEGIFGFSQNGPASSNWQIVPDSILNSSGISERINGINNSLIDIYMTNHDSMIISNVITNSFNDEVNNENDIPGFSKVLHVFIPALFNRPSNKILDICGNISITGDIDIFDGDMSIKNRLFVNYIDGNPDGIFPDTKNLTIGENTQIINIGNVEPSSRTEGIYAEEASYNFINIGAVQPSTTTKPYYIQMGNFSGSVPDVSQNKIVIGGATDDIVFGGGGITIKSEAEFLVTNRIVRVNNEAPDANLSAGSGLYVYENYGLGDTDQNAGFVAISDDRRGFNFKPTIKNSHIVTLETEDMSLNFNNPYNTEYGINDIQNGLLVLTKTYNNTGGDYSITVKPIDISNILIRDSALSNEERQFILTKLSVQDDVSFNTNLYVKDKIGIDTHNAIISLDISANDAIRIPVGTNAERELFNHQTGQIRFNTSTSQFEGYNNSGAWQGLGGVIDVDQNTFILAESGPTKDENQLRFFTADYNSDSSLMKPRLQMILDASNGGLGIGHNISSDISNVLYHPPSNGLTVQGDVSLNENLFVSGDISVNQNVYIGNDLIVDGNITVEQYRNETIINTTTTNYFLTVAEDMSLNGRLFVRDDVSFNSNLYLKDKLGIDTHSAVVSLDMSTNDALKLPIGSDAERPTLTSDYYHGFIRFNKNILYDGTGDYTYEGSYGLNEWKPLGQHWKGVIDTDGDTFITAEDSYGMDGDDLKFYTKDNLRMTIDQSGNFGFGVGTIDDISFNFNGNAYFADDVSLNGDLHIGQVAYTTRLEHPLSTASNRKTIDLGNSVIDYNNITGVPATDRNIESVPQGGIILWLRPNNIPQGFRICDGGENEDDTVDILGANVNIPDLRSKFVIGYHENDPSFGQVGNTGGSFNITSEQLPEHSHYSVENHSYGGTDYYLGQYNSVSTHASGGNYIGVSIDNNDETKRYTTSSTGSGQNYAPPYYVAVYIIRVSTALSTDQQLLGQSSFYVPHRLGIGTTTPAANLHIDYAIDLGSNDSYTDVSMAQILISDDRGVFNDDSGRFAIGFVNDYAFLQAAYHSSTTDISKNISMQPKGGNVGIGTTTPDSKFTVAGDMCGTTLYVNSLRKSGADELDTTATLDLGNHKINYNNIINIPTQDQNIESVPVGGVIMWGDPGTIPTGFYLCDGGASHGVTSFTGINGTPVTVPDLRSKFVIGYHDSDATFGTIGNTGGSATIAETNLPAHTHTYSGSVDADGNHNHGTGLGPSGESSMYHYGLKQSGISSYGNPSIDVNYDATFDAIIATSTEGSHSHPFSGTTETGSGSGTDYYQPYYVLMFLIRYTTPLTSDVQLYGQNVYYVPNRLGIGNTSPLAEIHISKTISVPADDSVTTAHWHTDISNSQLLLTGGSDDSGTKRRLALGYENTADYAFLQAAEHTDDTTAVAKNIVLQPNGGFVGIGTTSPTYTLEVNGNMQATSYNATSDARLKTNIQIIQNSIHFINRLQGISYSWIEDIDNTSKVNYGLIAQDVENVLPEVVHTSNTIHPKHGFCPKSIEYNQIIPHLIESIKTLSEEKTILRQEIDNLKNENEALKEKMKQYDEWFSQLMNK